MRRGGRCQSHPWLTAAADTTALRGLGPQNEKPGAGMPLRAVMHLVHVVRRAVGARSRTTDDRETFTCTAGRLAWQAPRRTVRSATLPGTPSVCGSGSDGAACATPSP